MATPEFTPVADALRARIVRHYADLGRPLEGAHAAGTLETNSGYAERRATPLLDLLADDGLPSVAGLDVVDLGCGFGAIACFFAASGARVVGIDRKPDRLDVGRDVAAAHGLDVVFAERRMQVTGMPPASFDIALLNNSLCYLVDEAQRAWTFREIQRILRPGGRVLLRNPNRWATRDPFTGLPLIHFAAPERATALARRLGRSRSRVRLTSPPAAARELRRGGFVSIRQLSLVGPRRPEVFKLVAAYHHFVARRPAA